MLRFILISILSLYLINRLFTYVFRVLGKPQAPPSFKRPPEGSIRVDSDPKKQSRRSSTQGGEYVDYEEIK